MRQLLAKLVLVSMGETGSVTSKLQNGHYAQQCECKPDEYRIDAKLLSRTVKKVSIGDSSQCSC